MAQNVCFGKTAVGVKLVDDRVEFFKVFDFSVFANKYNQLLIEAVLIRPFFVNFQIVHVGAFFNG